MTNSPAVIETNDQREEFPDPVQSELPAGLRVYTRDGHRLGAVKEAHERCFLIDVRFAFDYWLSRRAVATVEQERVTLVIDKSQVEDYLVDPDCVEDDHLEPASEGPSALGIDAAPA